MVKKGMEFVANISENTARSVIRECYPVGLYVFFESDSGLFVGVVVRKERSYTARFEVMQDAIKWARDNKNISEPYQGEKK